MKDALLSLQMGKVKFRRFTSEFELMKGNVTTLPLFNHIRLHLHQTFLSRKSGTLSSLFVGELIGQYFVLITKSFLGT